MDANIFYGLSIILAVGTLVALLMRSLGQPLIIGHILTGIIVGPAVLHVLKSPDALSVFGDIGIALLLFIVGLGMNPRVVAEVGKTSTIVALAEVTVTAVAGWLVAVALGLNHTEAFFIGFGLAVNSTIVALKLLGDKKELGRLYGKLTIGTSLVEDVLAAVVLLLVASVKNGQWLSIGMLGGLVVKGLLLGAVMYVVSMRLFPKLQRLIAGDQEFLYLFAIAWGLGSAALFAKAGFSLEIGALAAGIMLAPASYAQEIAARLRPLRDFFVIVFFIALGTELSFHDIGSMFWPIVAGSLVVLTLKPLTVMASLGILGYTKRTSFKTAATLSQVSEFSIILVILGLQRGLITQHIVTLLTFIALITIAVSTYLVVFSDKLYGLSERYLDLFERRKTQGEPVVESRNELVLFGYQRGGHEFVNLFKQMKKKYVVIDYDPEVIDVMEHRKVNFLYGDATDAELLEEAGVDHAKLVVSTIPDFDINSFLLGYLEQKNPQAVIILHADDPTEAAKFYEAGATYVVLPHYIGSEKVSAFISKSGLSKQAFHKERKKHLDYLEKHYGALEKLSEQHNKKLGHTIVAGVAALAKVKS